MALLEKLKEAKSNVDKTRSILHRALEAQYELLRESAAELATLMVELQKEKYPDYKFWYHIPGTNGMISVELLEVVPGQSGKVKFLAKENGKMREFSYIFPSELEFTKLCEDGKTLNRDKKVTKTCADIYKEALGIKKISEIL